MARLACIVTPHVPHRVTPRGNRRMAVLSEAGDYALDRVLLVKRLKAHGVVCSAYCLTPNHVHLLLTPTQADVGEVSAALAPALGQAHRRFRQRRRPRDGSSASGTFRVGGDGRDPLARRLTLSRVHPGPRHPGRGRAGVGRRAVFLTRPRRSEIGAHKRPRPPTCRRGPFGVRRSVSRTLAGARKAGAETGRCEDRVRGRRREFRYPYHVPGFPNRF